MRPRAEQFLPFVALYLVVSRAPAFTPPLDNSDRGSPGMSVGTPQENQAESEGATGLSLLSACPDSQKDEPRVNQEGLRKCLSLAAKMQPPSPRVMAHLQLELGLSYLDDDRPSGARNALEAVLTYRKTAPKTDIASAETGLAVLEFNQGHATEASPHLERALALWNEILPPGSQDVAAASRVAELPIPDPMPPVFSLALGPLFSRAENVLKARLDPNDLALLQVRLRVAALSAGSDPQQAIEIYRSILDTILNVVNLVSKELGEPTVPTLTDDGRLQVLAEAYNGLGTIALHQKLPSEAAKNFRSAVEAAGAEEYPDERRRLKYLTNLVIPLIDLNDWRAAQEVLKGAFQICERLSEDDGLRAVVLVRSGQVAQGQKDFSGAGVAYAKALAVAERAHGLPPSGTVEILSLIGAWFVKTPTPPDRAMDLYLAEAGLSRQMRIITDAGASEVSRANLYDELAIVYLEEGNVPEARAAANEILRLLEKNGSPAANELRIHVIRLLEALGAGAYCSGRPADALADFASEVDIYEGHPEIAPTTGLGTALLWLAMTYDATGDSHSALLTIDRAKALVERDLNSDRFNSTSVRQAIEDLLGKMDLWREQILAHLKTAPAPGGEAPPIAPCGDQSLIAESIRFSSFNSLVAIPTGHAPMLPRPTGFTLRRQ